MELTKQDKKHIDEQVRKLSFRIDDEAKEYMHLYQKTYYEKVIEICQKRIESINDYHVMVTKAANSK